MIQLISDFLSNVGKQNVLVEICLDITLAVIGICFTLLTVLHSFIENKKSLMLSYAKAIKETFDAEKNPMIYEKEQKRLASEYVARQKRLVKKIEVVIAISLTLNLMNLYPKFDLVTSSWYYGVDLMLFLVYMLLLVYLVFSYINLYEINVNNRSVIDITRCKCNASILWLRDMCKRSK